ARSRRRARRWSSGIMTATDPGVIDASRPPREGRRLATVAMAWMFLFGMIGTGLVGPNRTSIEREFGIGHAAFGIAFAALQLASPTIVWILASRARRFDRA